MRYGVFGDIHSNLAAYRAVLDALANDGVDASLCLGDIVGYGADAAECIATTRELNPILVGGNHDYAVAGKLGLEYFNTQAQAAGPHLRGRSSKMYLNSAPAITWRFPAVRCVFPGTGIFRIIKSLSV